MKSVTKTADRQIRLKPLTETAFSRIWRCSCQCMTASFLVIVAKGKTVFDQIINQGMCGRHHNLAKLEFSVGDAQAGISVFDASYSCHVPRPALYA